MSTGCGCNNPDSLCKQNNFCNILQGNKICVKNVSNVDLCNMNPGINFYRDTSISVENVDNVCIKNAIFRTTFNDPNCASSCDLSSIDLSQFCTQLNVQEIWNDLKALNEFDWSSCHSDYMSYKAFITEMSTRITTFIRTANEWLRRSTCMFCDIYHRIQDLVNRVTVLEQQMISVLKRLDLIEQIIGYPYDLSKGTIQDRLNSLEKCCEEVKKEIADIYNKITDIYNKINNINNEITNINNNIKNIYNTINEWGNTTGGGGTITPGYIRIYKQAFGAYTVPWSFYIEVSAGGNGYKTFGSLVGLTGVITINIPKSQMHGILSTHLEPQVVVSFSCPVSTAVQSQIEYSDHYTIDFDTYYSTSQVGLYPSNAQATLPGNPGGVPIYFVVYGYIDIPLTIT